MLSGAALGRAAYECWGKYGVPCFPCNDAKRPLGKWQDIAAIDEDALVALFDKFGSKARLIGAVMGDRSGLFALDFDLYKGEDAQQFLDILMASNCLPETRVHETQSGGLHYLYGVDKGKYPRNSVPHPGVEVRGEGGYIIVPPSHGYKVQRDGVVDAPPALLQRLHRADTAFRSLTISGLREHIMSGTSFHEALTSLAAKMHSRGDEPHKVMEVLHETMRASVASNPMHERHDRWKKIMEGSDGELARINASAFRKFNSRRDQMDVDAVKGQVDTKRRNRDVTLGGFFAPIPDKLGAGDFKSDTVQQAAQQQIDVDEFPFERSYNAANVSDQGNKTFLLYPLIMEGDIVVLSAEPKAGKTLTALTLCMHMAAGIPFGANLTPLDKDGNNVRVPIIYFALEGQGAVRKRTKAWLLNHQRTTGIKLAQEDLRLYIVERPINLTSDDAKQEIVDKLVLAQAFFKKKGWGDLGLVVFDTLTKAMPGKDQNSVEDTSAVFHVIDMMRESSLDTAVMFIHHNNRQNKAPRGSSNILAEPDTILSAEKIAPIVVDGRNVDCLRLSVYMARAINDDQKYVMAMHDMEIGLNSQNIMETAPVLEIIEDYDAQLSPTDASLRKNVEKLKDAFYTALWESLSNSANMELTFAQLAKSMSKNNKAGAYYAAHLNANSKDGAKAAWGVLIAPEQLPTNLSGINFTVTDNGVKMDIDGQAMMKGMMQ